MEQTNLTMKTHHECVVTAFAWCAQLEPDQAASTLQTAANVNIAAIAMSNKLEDNLVIIAGLSERLLQWLISFSVKLKLVYNDEVATASHPVINGSDILLATAFPHFFTGDYPYKLSDKVCMKMLIIIRLYQQELVDMMGKIQLAKTKSNSN